MKKIRINFADFWNGFNPTDNFIYNTLKKRYEIEIAEQPDYLFFSVFGESNLQYDCIKIFYTGENQSPDFNLTDYAVGFERLEFGDRYLRFPYCYVQSSSRRLENKHLQPAKAAEKEFFCNFIYSNNNANPIRDKFLDALNQYRPVQSAGRWRNNVGGPVADKLAYQSRCKFSIAFENCSHPGYITEKLCDAFAAGTVPIYWGDPTVSETFNPHSFINCNDFASIEEVVARVKEVDADDALYQKMMETPALQPGALTYEDNYHRLEEFLSNIMEQDPASARRFSRDYWQRRYTERRKAYLKAFGNSPRGIAERIYKKFFDKKRGSGKLRWALDRFLKKRVLRNS